MHPNRLFILQHAKHEQQQQQQRSKSGYTTGDSRYHRHLIYIDWSMVCTANVVDNVSYVSGHHKNTRELSARSRHNTGQAGWQGRQADKVGRLTRQADKAGRLTRQTGRLSRQTGRLSRQAGWQGRQAGWQGRQADKELMSACFVLCLLLAPLFCWSGCLKNYWVLSNLIILDIYGKHSTVQWYFPL